MVFYLFEQFATALYWTTAVTGVSHYLALVNMLLAVFNLLPAFPLDGGRMLRAVLWHWQKDLRRATRIASWTGAAFGLALMILGILAFIQGSFIGGMWWFLIGVFLRGAADASYRQLIVREMLSDKPVRHFMNANPITVPPAATINQLLEDYVYQYYFKLFPVVDNDRLIGCVTLKDIKKVPRERWSQTTVNDLTTPCSPENTVSPNTAAVKLVTEMAQPNASTRFMVVENNRLLGVISLKDLREFIALKLELESAEG
jgi:CBS domain-containing protein